MCNEYIMADLSRILERPVLWRDAWQMYFMPQGTTFPYIYWFRKVQYKKTKGKIWAVVPYLILRHFEYRYGIHLNTNIPVGKGLLIVHGGGVYLNCESIGSNFTVYQGVTLGTKQYGEKYSKKLPRIGNNVTIYTGAVVCGEITVNDNVCIGANAFVDKTVERGNTVVGIPAGKI